AVQAVGDTHFPQIARDSPCRRRRPLSRCRLRTARCSPRGRSGTRGPSSRRSRRPWARRTILARWEGESGSTARPRSSPCPAPLSARSPRPEDHERAWHDRRTQAAGPGGLRAGKVAKLDGTPVDLEDFRVRFVSATLTDHARALTARVVTRTRNAAGSRAPAQPETPLFETRLQSGANSIQSSAIRLAAAAGAAARAPTAAPASPAGMTWHLRTERQGDLRPIRASRPGA